MYIKTLSNFVNYKYLTKNILYSIMRYLYIKYIKNNIFIF